MVALPAVGVTRLSSIRRVVVLPEPFGPEEAGHPAGVDGEREVVHRPELLVLLGEAGNHDPAGGISRALLPVRHFSPPERRCDAPVTAWRSRGRRGNKDRDRRADPPGGGPLLPGTDRDSHRELALYRPTVWQTGASGPDRARTGRRRGSLSHFSDTPQDATSLGADDGSHGRTPDRSAAARRRGRPQHPGAALRQPPVRRLRRGDRDQWQRGRRRRQGERPGPRGARRDAARPGRLRGDPAAARGGHPYPGGLPDRAGRHRRQDPRADPRRRRLRHQAVQPGGADRPDPGGAAAHQRRRAERRPGSPSPTWSSTRRPTRSTGPASGCSCRRRSSSCCAT